MLFLFTGEDKNQSEDAGLVIEWIVINEGWYYSVCKKLLSKAHWLQLHFGVSLLSYNR